MRHGIYGGLSFPFMTSLSGMSLGDRRIVMVVLLSSAALFVVGIAVAVYFLFRLGTYL